MVVLMEISTNGQMLNVCVIGLGNQSLNDHIPALLRRSDIFISAVFDPNQAAVDNFVELFPQAAKDVNILQNLGDLNSIEIDFAIVAVPHDQYLAIIKLLCVKGIPFMKEKPFSRNLDEAMVIESIADVEKYCFTCTQRRYSPLHDTVKDAIKDLGDYIECSIAYNLKLRGPTDGWRAVTSMSGGGVIIDMGYHVINQLISWFGYPAFINAVIEQSVTTTGNYDTEDEAHIELSFRTPMVNCRIDLSRSSNEKSENYTITGKERTIDISKEGMKIYRNGDSTCLASYDYPAKAAQLDYQLDYFIKTIRSGNTFDKNHVEHLLTMKIIENCYTKNVSKDHAIFVNLIKHKSAI
jgi:predicted dehydrogenase